MATVLQFRPGESLGKGNGKGSKRQFPFPSPYITRQDLGPGAASFITAPLGDPYRGRMDALVNAATAAVRSADNLFVALGYDSDIQSASEAIIKGKGKGKGKGEGKLSPTIPDLFEAATLSESAILLDLLHRAQRNLNNNTKRSKGKDNSGGKGKSKVKAKSKSTGRSGTGKGKG